MLNYILRRTKRARAVRISVHLDGRVMVSAPYYVTKSTIERFVNSRMDWIQAKLAHFATLKKIAPPSRSHYTAYRARALKMVTKRLPELNAVYGFQFKRITIKRMRSRWGSCSRAGNLNFNEQIVHLAPHLADYVMVHELCHLGELNHSKQFWHLVAKAIPNFNDMRRELRHIKFC